MIRITGIKDSEKRYLKDRATVSLGGQIRATVRDRIEIPKGPSTRIKDSKGNLTFGMDICRDGVQEYLASEIYAPEVLKENEIDENTILRVWRPPNVVFDQKSISAHDGLPLTREHPKDFVDENNRPYLEKGINRGSFHDKQKSVISGTGFVTDPLMVGEIESGEYAEISDGYDTELEFQPGKVPEDMTVNGEAIRCTDAGSDYDLIMTGYYPNHIAIVQEGRAGNARIHDKKKGGTGNMSGFLENLLNKNKKSKIEDAVKKLGRSAVLRALADEEPDEEKKAALEALAEEEGEEQEDACIQDFSAKQAESAARNMREILKNPALNKKDKAYFQKALTEMERRIKQGDSLSESEALSQTDGDDAEGTQTEEEIAAQKRVVDGKPVSGVISGKNSKDPKEVFDMNITKEELVVLITDSVNAAVTARLGDAGQDIDLDDMQLDENGDMGGDPYVVDEFEVPDEEPYVEEEFEVEDADGPIDAEAIYTLAKNSQDPEVANLARALAQKLEAGAAEMEAGEMGEDAGFDPTMAEEATDAPPATEEARLESAAEGDAPEGGTPSNQATEQELEGMTDGDKGQDPVVEKDGYFIPKKLADASKLPVIMGNVIDTVNAYGVEGIDTREHLKDSTIYHRLIDASGIGKVTGPQGINEGTVNMAINAIRKNRPKVDGMSSLVDQKLMDSKQSGNGFNPMTEL